jgi:hypothetical protein
MTLAQMKTLVESSRTVRFTIDGREVFYNLLSQVLKKQGYAKLDREERGIVRLFLNSSDGPEPSADHAAHRPSGSKAGLSTPSGPSGGVFPPDIRPKMRPV